LAWVWPVKSRDPDVDNLDPKEYKLPPTQAGLGQPAWESLRLLVYAVRKSTALPSSGTRVLFQPERS